MRARAGVRGCVSAPSLPRRGSRRTQRAAGQVPGAQALGRRLQARWLDHFELQQSISNANHAGRTCMVFSLGPINKSSVERWRAAKLKPASGMTAEQPGVHLPSAADERNAQAGAVVRGVFNGPLHPLLSGQRTQISDEPGSVWGSNCWNTAGHPLCAQTVAPPCVRTPYGEHPRLLYFGTPVRRPKQPARGGGAAALCSLGI